MLDVNLSTRTEVVPAGASGIVYTISRVLGASSTLSLAAGTNGNLSLSGTNIVADQPIAAGTSQKALVFEELGDQAQRYAVMVAGRSAIVAPTPTPSPTPTPAPGATAIVAGVGQGLYSEGLEYYGPAFYFLDRSKIHSGWLYGSQDQTACPRTAAGYPTAIPNGKSQVGILLNVEGGLGDPSRQRYVVETTKTDWVFGLANGTFANVVSTIVNGKRRYAFDVVQATNHNSAPWIELVVTSLPTPFVDGTDSLIIFRADQEAALKGGGIFTPEMLARTQELGVIRFMDWTPANHNLTNSWADRPKVGDACWSVGHGVPLEVQIALCNQTSRPGYFHIPVAANAGYVTSMATMLAAQLAPSLCGLLAYGNENWNEQFNQFQWLRDKLPAVPSSDGNIYAPPWTQSGYGSTRAMGLFMKTVGYDPRFRPVWETQAVNTAVTGYNREGIVYAMAEWANASSPNYDPALAARYDEPGKLFKYGAVTTYSASTLNGPKTPSDRATIKGWAQGGEAGRAAAFAHVEFGTGLSTNYDTLAAMGDMIQANVSLFVDEGIAPIAYEGGWHWNADQGWPKGNPQEIADNALIITFLGDLAWDARSGPLYTKKLTIARTMGLVLDVNYNDVGRRYNGSGCFGVRETGYVAETPRSKALKDFHANPPAAPALAITATTTGSYNVGASPVTRFRVTGGIGLKTIAIGGTAAAGRQFDGFRTLKGALTTVQNVTARATVTDEAGTTAFVDVVQNVAAAPVGKKCFRIRATRSVQGATSADSYFNVQLSEVRFYDAQDLLISMSGVVVTSNKGVANPQHLVDGDITTQPDINQGAGDVDMILTFPNGSPAKPTRVEFQDRGGIPERAPSDFTFAWGDTVDSMTTLKTVAGQSFYPGHVLSFVPVYP